MYILLVFQVLLPIRYNCWQHIQVIDNATPETIIFRGVRFKAGL